MVRRGFDILRPLPGAPCCRRHGESGPGHGTGALHPPGSIDISAFNVFAMHPQRSGRGFCIRLYRDMKQTRFVKICPIAGFNGYAG